jgi:hypothetical protein
MRTPALVAVLVLACAPGHAGAQSKREPPAFNNARYWEDYSYRLIRRIGPAPGGSR